ncbi:MAG TPA: iron-sulfur cluster carrier protein ApbC [Candidatus Melainabacteria bacterium]|nr:iron-sulfur cluster carrier protein ApbC [Candidatus Melainabacteria bacterium]HIN63318.1 iron-sulfur cluster carrier protein ApbC [Candidatus Obscuribacterales bacterium]
MVSAQTEAITPEHVNNALRTVMDPDLHTDIVTLGMISDIKIEGGKVFFKLTLTTPACPVKEKLESEAKEAVAKIPGVTEVEMESGAAVAGQRRLPGGKEPVEGIRQIIAVTSGKGGVGKTTVSVNLAIALAHLGARVGLLDADITGPNVPLMMGVSDYQPVAKDNRILPTENYGVKVISMAFFVNRETPIIWRGPMLDKAIRQFLRDVQWDELDYLIVDMPPGTGDAQLTMVQATQLSGGVIVTTPQEVALLDGQKGLAMFQQMDVPVLGFVENMSYFQPPGSNERFEIFGHGGGKRVAEAAGVPFLGEIPLDTAIREGGDTGAPITATNPEGPVSQAFIEIAKQVAAQVSIHALTPA